MATINLLPEEPKGGIDLTPSIVETKNPEVLADRAQKASYGMGENSPGYAALLSNLHLGAEGQIRQEASTADAINTRKLQNDNIMNAARAAAAEGRPLTVEEQDYIRSQSGTEPVDPNIVLEDLYARRFMNDLEEYPDWGTFEEAFAEAPETAQVIRDTGQDYLTKQEIAQRILQEASERFENQSWVETGVDFVKGVVPFYTWVQTKDRIEGTGSGNVFLGQNMEEQIRGLYLMTPAEFERRLRESVTSLSEENAMEAVNFASNVLNYSSDDAAWDNVFTGLDALDVATLGAGAVVGQLSAANRYAKRVKSVVQGNAAPVAGEASRQVLQGNIQGASQTSALNRLNSVMPAGAPAGQSSNVAMGITRPQQQLDDLLKSTDSMLDPQSYVRNPGSLSSERTNRLVDALSEQNRLLYGISTETSVLARVLAPEAIAKGFELAEKQLRRQFSKLEDAIVDVRTYRESEEIFGGFDYVEMLIGKKDATGFGTPQQANVVARGSYKLPVDGYRVVEREGNYFISVSKSVDETDLQVRDLRIATEYATPETFTNTWLGWLRTPEDTLSRAHNRQRTVATFGGNAVMARLHESAKALGSLAKNERERLRTIMDHGRFEWRNIIDTDGQQKRVQGVFYKDVAGLEQAYLAKGFPMPTDKEIQAYFEFKNISDWDYAQRNAGMLRDKARLGIEQKSINVAQPNEAGVMSIKSTEFFEGREVGALPDLSGTPYTVAWVDQKTGKVDFGISNRLFGAQRAKLNELLESGNYKIIQPADARNEVLSNIVGPNGRSISGGEPVQFLVVRDTKNKPLSSIQIPYNEGGHWNYPQTGAYLKQQASHITRFGRRALDGDVTALYSQTNFEGVRNAELWNKARQMLANNDPGYSQFVLNNLPYSADEFARLFRGAKGAPEDAPFDLNAPFVVTQSGQAVKDVARVSEMFPEEILDISSSEHSLGNLINSQYAQQRNERLMTMENTGTEANPVYNLSPAPLMDPLESLARNATQMAKSRFFEDYKHSSVEDWVTQFADTMDVDVSVLRSDPMRYLREPVWKSNYQNAAKINAAKNARRNILQLLSQDGQDVAAWKWTRQKVVDSVAKAHGNKPLKILDPLLWDSRADPATIIRSVPFHAYLGLFNPVQLFLQASATTMAMAIDGNPLRSAQSVFAYWGMRNRGLMETNVKAQGLLTKTISNALGVSTDQLDEMYDLWKRSGAQIIGGEHARIDDALNPQMFYGAQGAAKALDAGLVFFKEGNNIHRGTSFALAYLEWRQKNPTARATQQVLDRILERTNLLSLNMTRASNASWQGGGNILQKAASVPAQFFAFQVRLSEMMLSGGLGNQGRLTRAEKARLLTMNSALWGVGAGVGGTIAGFAWPFAEAVRQYALENNIEIDEGMPKLAMEGVVSVGLETLTGQNLDVEGRFGPGGLSWLRDLMDGESFEVMGAGPSFLTDAYRQTAPFAMALVDVFSGNGNADIVQSTFIDALRVSSTGNNLVKAYQIWNAGEYLTKGDKPITTTEAGDPFATLAAALGMTPQEITDTYLKLRVNKDFKEAKTAVSNEALVWFERGIKAAADGDEVLSKSMLEKARAIMETGGFTPLERSDVFKRAMQVNRDLLDQVSEDFLRNDPSRMNLDNNPFVTGTTGGN